MVILEMGNFWKQDEWRLLPEPLFLVADVIDVSWDYVMHVSLMCCRWLAPLILLLDLYEKFSSVSKIKAVLETHVVFLMLLLLSW